VVERLISGLQVLKSRCQAAEKLLLLMLVFFFEQQKNGAKD
jgi:hypothetical protein